jgi:hypothetical protein
LWLCDDASVVADDGSGNIGSLALLRTNVPFRQLWAARTVSFFGDSLSLVALMLHVAQTTGQAFAVATLLWSAAVPALVRIDGLPGANAANGFGTNFGEAVGPLAAAVVIPVLPSAVGIGLLIGFLLLSRRGRPWSMIALLVAGFAISSASNLLTGLAWAVLAAFVFQLVRGFGIATLEVATSTIPQRTVPAVLLARVFGGSTGPSALPPDCPTLRAASCSTSPVRA